MLAASPLAKGLFQGVICESGGSFAPAKTGDPNGSGLPQWPAFSGKHPLAMHFSDKPRADAYPNLEKLELWEKYFAWRRGETMLPAPSGDGQ